jgi:hypothetical protein
MNDENVKQVLKKVDFAEVDEVVGNILNEFDGLPSIEVLAIISSVLDEVLVVVADEPEKQERIFHHFSEMQKRRIDERRGLH